MSDLKAYDRRRWVILLASCLINLCIGSLYAWSVFAAPMGEYLSSLSGTKITNLAVVFTIANSVGPITMISGGFINQKFGPRIVILSGGILFALGMIASGFARSLGMLIVTYGILVGLGVGMVYGCTISNSLRFFPDRRGLVGGIATASYGISSVIIPILASRMIAAIGITSSFKALGTAMLVIIVISALFIEKCPEDYVPSGYVPKGSGPGSGKDLSWQEMLRDRRFYLMLVILCCGATSGMMIISQASPLAQRTLGISAAGAAAIVSAIALFNTLGRIAAGQISDKIGALNTIKLVFAGSIAAMLLMYLSCRGLDICFYAGVLLAALMFGSIMGIYPGFTASQFGARNNNINFGIMFIGFAAAGYIGPTLLSRLYVSTGSDQAALLLALSLNVIGLILTYLLERALRK